MNKQEKKILAEYATKSDLEAMLRVARKEIKDWNAPYRKNPNLTMAALFNIFAGCMKGSCPDWEPNELWVKNAVEAFGEYMPLTPKMRDEILKLRASKKKVNVKPTYFPKPIDF